MSDYLKETQDILIKINEIKNYILSLERKIDFQSGIVCQKCGVIKNSVKNTRLNSGHLIRKRKCEKCGFSWNTEEVFTNCGCYKKIES